MKHKLVIGQARWITAAIILMFLTSGLAGVLANRSSTEIVSSITTRDRREILSGLSGLSDLNNRSLTLTSKLPSVHADNRRYLAELQGLVSNEMLPSQGDLQTYRSPVFLRLYVEAVSEGQIQLVTDFGVQQAIYGGTPHRFSRQISVPPQRDVLIEVSIRDLSRLRIYVNKSLYFSFNYSRPVFSSVPVVITQPEFDYYTGARTMATDLKLDISSQTNTIWPLLQLVSQVLALVLFGVACIKADRTWIRPQVRHATLVSPNFTALVVFLAVISIILTFVGSFSSTQLWSYFDLNGFTFSRWIRFSDYRDITDIAAAKSPYGDMRSNYPPFHLVVNRYLIGSAPLATMGMPVIAYVIFVGRRLLGSSIWNFTVIPSMTYPLIFALDRGSSDVIVFALIGFAVIRLWTIPKKFDFLASTCLGVAIGLKLFPIFFLPIFFQLKKWREGIAALLISATLTTTSFTFIGEGGLRQMKDFLRTLRSTDSLIEGTSLQIRNISIRGMSGTMKYFSIDHKFIRILVIAVFVSAVVSIVGAIVNRYTIATTYLVCSAVFLLVVPLSFEYRLVCFYPGLMLFLLDRDSLSKQHDFQFMTAILCCCFMPIYLDPVTGNQLGSALRSLMLMVVVFLGCSALWHPRSRKSGVNPSGAISNVDEIN